jgi:hypothetical protein
MPKSAKKRKDKAADFAVMLHTQFIFNAVPDGIAESETKAWQGEKSTLQCYRYIIQSPL